MRVKDKKLHHDKKDVLSEHKLTQMALQQLNEWLV
jgi:hypothetical protein